MKWAYDTPGAVGLHFIRRRKSARDLLQKALYTVGLASSPLTQSRSQAEEALLRDAGMLAPHTRAFKFAKLRLTAL